MQLGLFAVVVVAVAADVGPGVPGFDARLEKVVVDGSLPPPLASRGVFVSDGGVALQAFSPWGETSLLWDVPFGDGVVRARFLVGEQLDHALVFRARTDAP